MTVCVQPLETNNNLVAYLLPCCMVLNLNGLCGPQSSALCPLPVSWFRFQSNPFSSMAELNMLCIWSVAGEAIAVGSVASISMLLDCTVERSTVL